MNTNFKLKEYLSSSVPSFSEPSSFRFSYISSISKSFLYPFPRRGNSHLKCGNWQNVLYEIVISVFGCLLSNHNHDPLNRFGLNFDWDFPYNHMNVLCQFQTFKRSQVKFPLVKIQNLFFKFKYNQIAQKNHFYFSQSNLLVLF